MITRCLSCPKIPKCIALILGLGLKFAAVQSDFLVAQKSSTLHLIGLAGISRHKFEFKIGRGGRIGQQM